MEKAKGNRSKFLLEVLRSLAMAGTAIIWGEVEFCQECGKHKAARCSFHGPFCQDCHGADCPKCGLLKTGGAK
jgi:hypothetical protein